MLVNLATAVIGRRRAVDLRAIAAATPKAAVKDAQVGVRSVWFDGGFIDAPVYKREWFPAFSHFTGPAIVEQLDCTTVIAPQAHVQLDIVGNLVVDIT